MKNRSNVYFSVNFIAIVTTIIESVDNAKLKEALKSGEIIGGAELLMKPSLRKYAAKKALKGGK